MPRRRWDIHRKRWIQPVYSYRRWKENQDRLETHKSHDWGLPLLLMGLFLVTVIKGIFWGWG